MILSVPCFQKEQSREIFSELLFSPYFSLKEAIIHQQLTKANWQSSTELIILKRNSIIFLDVKVSDVPSQSWKMLLSRIAKEILGTLKT